VALAMAGSPSSSRGDAAAAQKRTQDQPNVVVLMTDDQTQEEMRFLPNVKKLIADKGATFPTNVTNWPLCCPSRATFQTGQYAHNHHVLGNKPPRGGFGRLDTSETLPVWLQRAGYYTAHIGKYLNGYEDSDVQVPPGWSEWHGSKATYRYYGYTLLENGQLNTYGSVDEDADDPSDPASYSTDVYTDKAVDIVDRRAPSNQPFFLLLAYLAPHSGGPNKPASQPQGRCENTAKPAIRDKGTYETLPLPQPPNYNEADTSDKPDALANRDPLDADAIAKATRNYRCRAESLLAIDDSVKRVMDALRASGELDDTLVIFTSDNGFFHGEHRIESGKNRVYEEAIRVPLLMRGPDIPKDVSVDDISINADLAPTILDAAGATAGITEDGVSLLPYAENPSRKHGRELLIEQESRDGEDGEPVGVKYTAVRTSKYKYVENASGEIELYDLDADPFELQNLAGNPAYADAQSALASRLAKLRDCRGESCHSRPSMKLKLPRAQRPSPGKKPCVHAGGFVAKVRNKAQSALVEVRLRVDAKSAGVMRGEPFERKIKPRLLRRTRKPEIDADAMLVDGRVLTLHDKVRICR
jgi:N-acetylglucosamine-6-sulfatase